MKTLGWNQRFCSDFQAVGWFKHREKKEFCVVNRTKTEGFFGNCAVLQKWFPKIENWPVNNLHVPCVLLLSTSWLSRKFPASRLPSCWSCLERRRSGAVATIFKNEMLETYARHCQTLPCHHHQIGYKDWYWWTWYVASAEEVLIPGVEALGTWGWKHGLRLRVFLLSPVDGKRFFISCATRPLLSPSSDTNGWNKLKPSDLWRSQRRVGPAPKRRIAPGAPRLLAIHPALGAPWAVMCQQLGI